MNANANVENIGSRYLFDKNETGLTLEDNLITTLVWDIQEKGHMNALEYIGGNYIKLTKIPKGIKVYWNTKNDRASAMLLDDVNRGVKVSKQNKNGQLMTYRNYYLWSEGTLSQDETNFNIILEFTGKGVEVEYLVGSATEIQLLADQFNALNDNLKSLVSSLKTIEVTIPNAIPNDFSMTLRNRAQTSPAYTYTQVNHNNHIHAIFKVPTSPTLTSAQLQSISRILLSPLIGQLIFTPNYDCEYSLGLNIQVGTNINDTGGLIIDNQQSSILGMFGLQSLTTLETDDNMMSNISTNSGQCWGTKQNNQLVFLAQGRVEGMRAIKNVPNYVGAGLCIINANPQSNTNLYSSLLHALINQTFTASTWTSLIVTLDLSIKTIFTPQTQISL